MTKRKRHSAAFQGEKGAFSHTAAMKLLGRNIPMVPCSSFRAVFEALHSNAVTHAVIPIENTLHGSIHENYDHLLEYDFAISGETSVRISHCLIGLPGAPFRGIRRVFSHPVAINQCRKFLEIHKEIEAFPFYDTAGSVKMIIEENLRDAAAIASQTAAALYRGKVLRRNLEDDRQNFTRFFLLTKQADPPKKASGDYKTSIVFSTSNVPGALFRAMACFALRDVNLTKIESRPLRGKPWEYLFYVDIRGSRMDQPVDRALANLAEITHFSRILGSYRPTP